METGVCPAAGNSHRREVNQSESSSFVAERITTPKTRSRIEDLGNWTFIDALDWRKREQSAYRYSTITYAQWMDFLVQLCAGQIATRLARQGSRQRVLFSSRSSQARRDYGTSVRSSGQGLGGWMTKETNDGGGRLADILGWRGHGPVTLFHLLLS